MTDKRYDAVFVGNSFISLSAAALLSKEGHSVLLLDWPGRSDFHIPDPSFEFSTGPLLYFGFEHEGAIEGLFSKLAFPIPSLQQNGLSFKKITPMLQIVQSSHRINLYREEQTYLDELKREYGSEAQKLKILFDRIEREASIFYPMIGQFQQLEIARVRERLGEWKKQLDFYQAVRAQQNTKAADLLSQYTLSSDLREYFNLLSLFAFKKSLSELSAFDFILLLSSLKKGGVRVTGGYTTFLSFFRRLIEGWGGTVYKGKQIYKVEKRGKQMTRFTLSNGVSLTGAQFILSKPSEHPALNFYFTIPHKLVPLPMKESLVMTWGDDIPSKVKDILVVRLNHHEEETNGSTEIRRIAVSIYPQDKKKILKSAYKSLEKRILKQLNGLIPFSNSEIKSVPLPEIKKTTSFVEDNIFSQIENGTQIKGARKEIIKGVSQYLRPKQEKNVFIFESDQTDTIARSASYVAGMRLAKLIKGPEKQN